MHNSKFNGHTIQEVGYLKMFNITWAFGQHRISGNPVLLHYLGFPKSEFFDDTPVFLMTELTMTGIHHSSSPDLHLSKHQSSIRAFMIKSIGDSILFEKYYSGLQS